MRAWMLRWGMVILIGMLSGTLFGCGHNPNHGINMDRARAAADRVHKPPPKGVKMMPGTGG
jgi:hypothetical protein